MSCSFKLISWRKIRYRLQFDCSTDPAATMNDSSSAHPGAAARPPVQSCSVLSLSAFAIYPALTSPRSAHRKMSWRVLVPFQPCERNLTPSAPIFCCTVSNHRVHRSPSEGAFSRSTLRCPRSGSIRGQWSAPYNSSSTRAWESWPPRPRSCAGEIDGRYRDIECDGVRQSAVLKRDLVVVQDEPLEDVAISHREEEGRELSIVVVTARIIDARLCS